MRTFLKNESHIFYDPQEYNNFYIIYKKRKIEEIICLLIININ